MAVSSLNVIMVLIVYERFNEPLIGKYSSPPPGSYFKYNTPIRVGRGG